MQIVSYWHRHNCRKREREKERINAKKRIIEVNIQHYKSLWCLSVSLLCMSQWKNLRAKQWDSAIAMSFIVDFWENVHRYTTLIVTLDFFVCDGCNDENPLDANCISSHLLDPLAEVITLSLTKDQVYWR